MKTKSCGYRLHAYLPLALIQRLRRFGRGQTVSHHIRQALREYLERLEGRTNHA